MNKKADLLWCDMEMTGLDPGKDVNLEIAVIATDWDFNELASFESGIFKDADTLQRLMNNDFYKKYPLNKKLLMELSAKSPAESAVEQQLCRFVSKHFDTSAPVVLAGNSIHQDRRFIRAYMPFFDAMLHYRMLDVSAWKVVFEGKFGGTFEKKESHRALDDIRESIAELKFYTERIKYDKP